MLVFYSKQETFQATAEKWSTPLKLHIAYVFFLVFKTVSDRYQK